MNTKIVKKGLTLQEKTEGALEIINQIENLSTVDNLDEILEFMRQAVRNAEINQEVRYGWEWAGYPQGLTISPKMI